MGMSIRNDILILLRNLVSQGGMIAIFSLILTRSRFFHRIFAKLSLSRGETALLIAFFSAIGIIGTYTGIPVQGALANTRVVGVFVAGLIGGPVIGVVTGIVAGVHRWAIDIGGFTAFPCMISTIIGGLLAAGLSNRFQKSSNKWLFAGLWGAVAEIIQMIIIIATARPLADAIALVETIGLPMIIGNGLAIALFVAIAESLYRDHDRVAAVNAQLVLSITEQTLPFFSRGYNSETAGNAGKIILEQFNLAAVNFTDTDRCIAHAGLGGDHHRPGSPIKTQLTRQVLEDGIYRIANTRREIDCEDNNCPLLSAIIVPLTREDRVIGALKLYRDAEYGITRVDEELALGLASLFSLQIEKSRIEEQSRLINRAELRALQSQINPHFLFNAINTVSSLLRTKPEKARDLLLDLSDYYRYRLQSPEEFIPLNVELEHTSAYLEIERARFEDRLEVEFATNPDCSCHVPPLILQPLVENAVKHGIQQSIRGGKITVKAEKTDRGILLSVEDNGCGIEQHKLKDILSGRNGSVGLSNVHQRLRNAYGEDCGLNIESTPGEVTKVWMTIPLAS